MSVQLFHKFKKLEDELALGNETLWKDIDVLSKNLTMNKEFFKENEQFNEFRKKMQELIQLEIYARKVRIHQN